MYFPNWFFKLTFCPSVLSFCSVLPSLSCILPSLVVVWSWSCWTHHRLHHPQTQSRPVELVPHLPTFPVSTLSWTHFPCPDRPDRPEPTVETRNCGFPPFHPTAKTYILPILRFFTISSCSYWISLKITLLQNYALFMHFLHIPKNRRFSYFSKNHPKSPKSKNSEITSF